MKITEIKEHRKGLTYVTADGEEFIFNTDTVLSARLKTGMCLEREELCTLLEKSECDRAKSRALWYLSRADHSKKALYDKLCRAFNPQAAEFATERMEELGLIDDFRYAKNIVAALSEANVSDREILRKLFAKGVPNDIAKQAVEENESNPSRQLAELLEKKYSRRLSSEDNVRKVFASLIRKGFSYGDVKAALKEYSEKIDNCEEF